MITMSEELYNRTRAFVRTMTATCRSCMRPKSTCDTCDLYQARHLMASLDDAGKPVVARRARINAPSYKERVRYYCQIVRSAGRYVSAREIDTKNEICSRALKHSTLQRMVKAGFLKTFFDGKTMFFAITPKGDNAK